MTNLPYRLVAQHYDGTAWQTLQEHRDVATETDAHAEGRRWLKELRDRNPDELYEINVMREITRKPRAPRPKKYMAYHEAGHAVAAWHFKYPIVEASIVPDGIRGGFVAYTSPVTSMNLDFDDAPEVEQAIRNDIVVGYAGRAAELLFCPRSEKIDHSKSDIQLAAEIASYLTALEFQEALHAELLGEARSLVEKYRTAVEAVAKALLKRKELSGDEVTQLIEDATSIFRLRRSELFDYRDLTQRNPFLEVEGRDV